MIFKNYENKIVFLFFLAIVEHLLSVINGLRPVNLKDYRTKSGNDKGEGGAKRFAGLCPQMTMNLTSPSSGVVTRLLHCARNDIHCLGRSMIEMLGVLAIIGVLSVGGIAGYSKAMTKFKVNKTIDMITSAIVNTKTAFAHEKYYSSLDEGVVIDNLNLLPKDRKTPLGGSISIFPWCEEIDFEDADYNKTQKSFNVYIGVRSKEACLNLLSYNWAQAGVTLIELDNIGSVSEAAEEIYLAKVPVNLADMTEMCSNIAHISFYVGTKPESECTESYVNMWNVIPINFNPYDY